MLPRKHLLLISVIGVATIYWAWNSRRVQTSSRTQKPTRPQSSEQPPPPSRPTPPAAAPVALAQSPPSALPSSANLLASAWQVNDSIPEPEFAQFVEWARRYVSATPAARPTLEAEGIQLAQNRRVALRQLIEADPARALALAVPLALQQTLPDAIKELLEVRVSGRGPLDVFAALAEPGKEAEVKPNVRVANIDGHAYDAYVYGRRLGEPTRRNVSMNGIVVDNAFALNESPLRVLEPEEAAALPRGATEPLCAISQKPSTINRAEVVVQLADQPVFLCGAAHVEELAKKTIEAEVAGDSGGGGAEVAASATTEGRKKLIVIRVDFSDLANPYSDSTGIAMINGLDAYYMEMSYGRSGFYTVGNGSDLTPVFRMPQTAAYYGGNNQYAQLRTDARNAASAAGYTLNNYNSDITWFGAVPGWSWNGWANIGASGAWIRNAATPGICAHEIGHNYGLNHANYWDTGGNSIIGSGSSIEYGDSFDDMGTANGGALQFNVRYKSYLNWLQSGETLNVTSSGTYRIYPHDQTNSTGVRGLRIVRSSTTNYWVEFRQKFTSNKWLMSGAGIRWAGNGNEKSHLLDTTPGSPDGKNDSALVLGRTFSDYGAGIHITTLRKGGTTPESLDIVVNLGTFSGNNPPAVAVSGPSSGAAGATLTFNASATDANGDTLAYYWDFGDATFGTNGAACSKSWSTAGEYVVRCVVSDMKGGVASDSLVVTIGTPTTYRISGLVYANNQPLQGVRVSASSTKMGYTDNDGSYTIAGLAAGTYTATAVKEGYTFAPYGFSNPVTLSANAAGVHFTSGGSIPGNVTLTSPSAGSSYTAPASVSLAASATAASGQTVAKVEFFQGTTKLGEVLNSPYTYTWSGVGTGSYTLTARSTSSSGILATSAPVAISVNGGTVPTITSQPQNQTVVAGGNASFSVTATGALTYQWRFNGSDLAGATSSSLALANVQANQAGGYSVVAANSSGAVTSSVAILTVNCSYALSASSASFSAAAASGSVNVTAAAGCAWSVSGVPTWITINSGSSGSGNGTVSYSVANNTSSTSRGATLTIAGQSYSVSQSGATTPTSVTLTGPAAGTYAAPTNLTLNATATAGSGLFISKVEFFYGTNKLGESVNSPYYWNWLNVPAGTHTLTARATDSAANVATSAPVVIVVSANLPVITTQPQNQTILAGGNATFSVSASSLLPLSYQWRLNGSNLSGATNSSLALANILVNQAGGYSVVVANSGGSVTSTVATLTVNCSYALSASSASFSAAPASGSVNVTCTAGCTWGVSGVPAWLTITSGNGGTGNGTVSYSVAINTSTSSRSATLTIAGQSYSVSQSGAILPASVTLTAPLAGSFEAPTNLTLSANATATSGQTVTKVEFFQGTTKLGEDLTAPYSFTWSSVSLGSYTLTARSTDSGANMATSAPVVITVFATPPVITAQPQSQTIVAGGNASLSVVASSLLPLTYQWRLNGSDLAGAANSSLALANVQVNQAGGYSVVVANSGGAVTSTVATLTVNCSYALSASSASFTAASSSGSVNVTCAAGCTWGVSGVPTWITITSGNGGTGNGTVSYSVATNTSTSSRNATLTIAGQSYSVSQSGAVLPGSVTLTAPLAGSYEAPTNITLSANASATSGQTVTKVEFFQGTTKLGEDLTAPYSFTWSNTPLGSYTLTARSTDSGANVANSAPVAITIFGTPPLITTQPQSQTVLAGGNASFSVSASSLLPLSYQWRLNGSDLSGATNSSLALANVQVNQAGGYSVVVANSGGAVASAVAVLTVNCSYALSASSASFTAAASSGSVNLTCAAGCTWGVSGVPAWLTITSGNGGTGNGTVNYSVATNTSTASRSATLTIAGQSYSVSQSGTVLPGSVALTAPLAGSYEAPTNLTLNANASATSGQTVTKVEFFQGTTKLGEDLSAPYSFTWSNVPLGSYTLTARSTDSGVNIATSAPVAITVFATSPVITTQPQSQTILVGGNATFSASASSLLPLSYQWRLNGSDLSGATNSSLALANVQVNQAGGYSVVVANSGGSVASAVAVLTVNCSYALSASSASFTAAASSGSVNLTCAAGCTWGVSGVPAWLTITSGNGGTGNGTVSYSVATNSSTASRSATLTIAGQSFSVSQSGTVLPGSVALTAPLAGSYEAPTNFTLNANASATSGQTVTKVEFFQGTTKLGEDLTAPYSFTWSNVPLGSYTLTARSTDSGANMATSAPVALTVFATPPVITAQPQSQTIVAGANATFSVAASSALPLSYQWRFSGSGLAGATNSSLALANAQVNQAGGYSVVVANSGGAVTSSVATLTVNCSYALSAASASFSAAAASGSVNVTCAAGCSWSISGVPGWLTINSGGNGNGNGTVSYSVATNTSSTSRGATLTIAGQSYSVNQSGAIIPGSVTLTGPIAGSYQAPTNLTLAATATATSGQSITKVEFFQGTTKLGEDLSAPYSFIWSNVSLGSYTLTARSIDSGANIATSAPVALTVFATPPVITTQPQSQTIVVGGNAGFNVGVSSALPVSYQWRLDNIDLAGATNSSLALANVQLNQGGGYCAVVVNSGGAITSAVAMLTVNCAYALSASSAAFPAADSSGSVNVSCATDCGWVVGNVPSWITINSGSSGYGNGTVSYSVATNTSSTSRGATLTIAGRAYSVSQNGSVTDVTPPTVTFNSPLDGATVTNTSVTLSGTAADDTGVARVEWRVGSSPYSTASGSSSWTAQATLPSATNLVTVRSVDLLGNYSSPITHTIFYNPGGTLNLDVRGKGNVKGGTNGQKLTVGKTYTVTAQATGGYVFSNWTGDLSSDSPTLTFTMPPHLTLVANFVTNPFAPCKGVFNGLFFETNDVHVGRSGFFTFKVTDKGTYSAQLRMGMKKYTATGRLSLSGQATNIVTRAGTNALFVSWQVALDGTEQIHGEVSDGTWTASLLGDRACYTVEAPAKEAGNYTYLLFGSPGSSTTPQGDSIGTFTMGIKGVGKLSATLADRSTLVSAATLSKTGYWPLYAPLYRGEGALLGWIRFASTASTDLDARVSWIKPAGDQYYPNGFVIEPTIAGSRYAPPLLNLTPSRLSVVGGELATGYTNHLSIGIEGRFDNAGPQNLTMSLSVPRGLFSGTLSPIDGSTPAKFKGAFVQKLGYGAGFFLGTNQSGRVQLSPGP